MKTIRVNLDFKLFYWVFDGFFETIFFIWLPMKLSVTIIVYTSLKYYANKRISTENKSNFNLIFSVSTYTFISLFYRNI